jgi:Reverse transcriptase (RNA-dependent DNA polymerase)
MQDEMKSLHENNTFKLVELPRGKNMLKNKWVYRVKSESQEAKLRYKVRLVMKGFDQKKGVDVKEIFSSVVKMSSIWVVLGLAASLDLEIEQLNVKTTFLHGDLEEEIYMEQPERFEKNRQEYLVCKLRRSLYGLKQALRNWYKRFDFFMCVNKFEKANSDSCVFMKRYYSDDFIIFLLYVDDILVIGSDLKKIKALKGRLGSEFTMKDLGATRQIFGIRITRDRKDRKFWLSQEKYIEKVLQRFNMDKA